MSRNPVLYKGLVVGVIVLFIGIGIQPAFADKSIESDNSELAEITIEFYETDRTYNHTVLLTKGQIRELENLINNVEIKLGNADNKIEKEAIYKDTVVLLNDYCLLPKDISVEKAQELVTGKEYNSVVVKLFERWYKRNHESMDDNENILCLIAGDGFIIHGARGIMTILAPIWNFIYKGLWDLGEKYPFLEKLCHEVLIKIPENLFLLWVARPFGVGFELFFGCKIVSPLSVEYRSCPGDFISIGLNGIISNKGNFYGQLPLLPFIGLIYDGSVYDNIINYYYPGAVGFTGIKMLIPGYYTHYIILGSALWFKIGEEPPEV